MVESVEAVPDVPLLLYTCHNSRAELATFYTLQLGHLLRKPVCINLDYDNLFFGGQASIHDGSNTFGRFMDFAEAGSDDAMKQLQALKGDL